MKGARAFLLALAGLVLQLGMTRGWVPGSEGARVVIAFALLVLWPGAAWLRILDQPPPGGAWLSAGWALALGVAWNAVLLSATAFAGVRFTWVIPVAPFASAALWCAATLRPARTAQPKIPVSGTFEGYTPWLVAAAALFAALHCERLGARLTLISDSPDHIGTLRRMLEHGALFPSDAFYRDAGVAGVDPRKSLWHGIVALTCAQARVDPLEAWRQLPALLAPLMVLNVAALGVMVGGASGAAIAAWALLLTYGGSLQDSALRDCGNAARMADQLAIAACVAALADLTHRTRGSRIVAATIAMAAVATHVFAAFQLAIVLGALAVALALEDRRRSPRLARLTTTSALMLLAGAPFAIWQVLRTPPALNTLHTESQGLMTLWGQVRVVSPGVLWDWMGAAWLLLPLLIVPLARARRESVPTLFLLTTTLAAGAVMFLPPVVRLLEPRLGYLLMRVVWILPLAGFAAWALPRYAARVRAAQGRSRWAAVTLLVLVLLALLPAFVDALRTPVAWARMAADERFLTPLPWRGDLARADSLLGAGRVVLSDPVTSYSVPMLSRQYVVTMLDQHSPPTDSNAVRRLLDARDALDPYGDWARTREVVRRYGVEAIVLNNRFREIPPADYWAPRPEWFAAERRRLDEAPAAFDRLVDKGDFVVYRVRRGALDSLSGSPAPRPFVIPFRADEQPIAHRLAPWLPTLLTLSLTPAVVSPGDTLQGCIAWRGSGAHQSGSYRVMVRFDQPLGGALHPPDMLAKPVRKVLERAQGRLYRFRADHLPVAGSYGVDLWERDQVIRDSFLVVVPRAAAPGPYQVSVRMNRQPHYPNLRLSDYFFERDQFAGVTMGLLEVIPGDGRAHDSGRPALPENGNVRH